VSIVSLVGCLSHRLPTCNTSMKSDCEKSTACRGGIDRFGSGIAIHFDWHAQHLKTLPWHENARKCTEMHDNVGLTGATGGAHTPSREKVHQERILPPFESSPQKIQAQCYHENCLNRHNACEIDKSLARMWMGIGSKLLGYAPDKTIAVFSSSEVHSI